MGIRDRRLRVFLSRHWGRWDPIRGVHRPQAVRLRAIEASQKGLLGVQRLVRSAAIESALAEPPVEDSKEGTKDQVLVGRSHRSLCRRIRDPAAGWRIGRAVRLVRSPSCAQHRRTARGELRTPVPPGNSCCPVRRAFPPWQGGGPAEWAPSRVLWVVLGELRTLDAAHELLRATPGLLRVHVAASRLGRPRALENDGRRTGLPWSATASMLSAVSDGGICGVASFPVPALPPPRTVVLRSQHFTRNAKNVAADDLLDVGV